MRTWRFNPEREENQLATKESHLEILRLQKADQIKRAWAEQDEDEQDEHFNAPMIDDNLL